MDAWGAVRQRAREVRASLELPAALNGGMLLGCRELIALALDLYGLTQVEYAADDPQLGGARAKLDGPYAIVNGDLSLGLQIFALAHELGHYVLGHHHGTSLTCTDEDVEALAADNPFAGREGLAIYHPRQRIEIEASTFAAEFLAPQRLLVQAVSAGMTLAELVWQLQLPERVVINQLIVSLLSGGREEVALPETPRQPLAEEGLLESLDLSQRRAAEWERGPLLVMAGPGTGKTRTLSGRVQFLVEQRQVEPRRILVLTFSNKAAQELRDRLAGVLGQRVTELTIETFHAFALELLKRYAQLVDLPMGFRIADTLDGYLMLDDRLAELNLEHYTTIWNPGQYLPGLLRAISRAKDELKSPEEYARAAQQLAEEAATEEERLAADKAREVARTYAFYQQLLMEYGVVDYGDLIVKAVHLLEEHAGVQAEVQQQYQHILVDEYQDVNRGCARLLRALAGDGQGLWVVGDLRQSIYQFRGASPANIGEFEREYVHAQRLQLAVNYRSQPLLVKIFSKVAQQMAVDDPSFAPWEAARSGGDGGTVRLCYTANAQGESDLIAHAIQEYQVRRVDLRSVAILCRTNAQAERLAQDLEERGVPVAYLGNLFNRQEVKQILGLLALAESGDGSALLGLGDIIEPAFRPADIHTLLGGARALNLSFPHALLSSRDIEGLSEVGRLRAEALGREIERCRFSDGAAEGLVRFLCGEQSRFIRRLLQQKSLAAQLKLIAIGELLQLGRLFNARQAAGFPGLAQLTFIEYVHRLISLGEGRVALPPTIDQVDAVRILTVHMSKGLEFPIVFVPYLVQGRFPARRQADPCPLPSSLGVVARDDEHEFAEHCLFFVAISRARDQLVLSRAHSYRSDDHQASAPFWEILESCCAQWGIRPQFWNHGESGDAAESLHAEEGIAASDAKQVATPYFTDHELEQYQRCPRRYYYQYRLRLQGTRPVSAVRQFEGVIDTYKRWLREQARTGTLPDWLAVRDVFERTWEELGPHKHSHGPFYRQRAELIAHHLYEHTQEVVGQQLWIPVAEAKLPRAVVRVHFDESIVTAEAVVLRLYRLGPERADHTSDARLSLYRQAAAPLVGDKRLEVQLLYLEQRSLVDVKPPKEQFEHKRLHSYDVAAAGIIAEVFPPQPGEQCGRCPFVLICPN